jgi:membrane protein DedA with SNARE-associated domain
MLPNTHDVATKLIHHVGYLGEYALVAIGNLGIPTGIEFIILTAGALTTLGTLPGNAFTVGTVAVAGELTGAAAMYSAGYFGGRRFIARYGHVVGVTKASLDRVEQFFEHYGRYAVFLARFVPFVRGLDGLPAGVAKMHPLKFFGATLIGSSLFCYSLAALGVRLAKQPTLAAAIERNSFWGLLIPLAVIGVVLVRRRGARPRA